LTTSLGIRGVLAQVIGTFYTTLGMSLVKKADAPQEILIRIMIVLGSGSHSQAGYTIRIKCEISKAYTRKYILT
jgi:hypothetical protein